jgi:hypothetical protein
MSRAELEAAVFKFGGRIVDGEAVFPSVHHTGRFLDYIKSKVIVVPPVPRFRR